MNFPKDILFSVNEYDRDGDVAEMGIFLHFGDVKVKVANSIENFKTIIPCMQSIVDEISANYGSEL
jgi:hypothetical protein